MTRRHKLCQRHLYNDRKQRALPSIRKTPTNYADCPYQLRRNGKPADVVGLIDDDKDFGVIGQEFAEELA